MPDAEVLTYEDLIRQWFSRAGDESDEFTKFIFLYIAFTALMTRHYNWDGSLGDRNVIEKIKRDTQLKELYYSLVSDNDALREALVSSVDETTSQPIPNTTRPRQRDWDGIIREIDNWDEIVEFWYRVRNNLFHGHKTPEFERDCRLVKLVYQMMFPLMQHFIDNNLDWNAHNS